LIINDNSLLVNGSPSIRDFEKLLSHERGTILASFQDAGKKMGSKLWAAMKKPPQKGRLVISPRGLEPL